MPELRPGGRWISPAAPAFHADLAATRPMFALPCFGGQLSTATLRGLLETQQACLGLGIPFLCLTVSNESLVQRARNSIVAHFLASDCTHLFFVDADIGFGADCALRVLGQMGPEVMEPGGMGPGGMGLGGMGPGGVPVLGGLYRRKRSGRVDWAVNWLLRADDTARRNPVTGAVEVAALGTGFLCIARRVLERLVAALPETRYRPDPDEGAPGAWRDHCHALFDTGIDPASGRYLSEDYLFCHRWRALGGELWCDPGLLLEHHGQACFEGDPMSAFTPTA